MCSLLLITDTRQLSSCSCTCAANNQMKMHSEPGNKRKDNSSISSSCRNCHCPLRSVEHKGWNTRSCTGTVHSYYKKNLWYHLHHMDKFSYLYSLLCILCMAASSASVENIVIEDQQTQVGHFFFYNISTNISPLKDSFQLKVRKSLLDIYVKCITVRMCCV